MRGSLKGTVYGQGRVVKPDSFQNRIPAGKGVARLERLFSVSPALQVTVS